MTISDKTITTLSSKGQVVLPKAVRDALGLKAGARLRVTQTQKGILLTAENEFPTTTIDEVFGCLKYDGPAKTIEEMNQAIADEVMARHARGRY